jgi:hypothetical protein
LFGDTDDGTVRALLERLDDVRLGVILFVIGQALMVLAAALGAAVVVALSRRQAEAAALLGPAPAPPVGSSPPAWHPDPTGRFDHRYWDGRAWTDHVARDGVAQSDPV